MARAAKKEKNNIANIRSLPVQGHVGASKFVNDDWGTIGFSIPRSQIQSKFTEPELRYNSIYFLFGYEDSKEVVYVGQALKRTNGESVLARVREHDVHLTEKFRDKWSWIVTVTNVGGTWKSTELDALESIFINEIPKENNLNGRKQNNGGADLGSYKDKVNQIKNIITAIGFNIFSSEETSEELQVTPEINENTVVEDLHNGMARIPEIVTPQKIVKAMVDILPQDVWNSKTKFLDPACKGGEYLREIYDRLMENETIQSEFPNTIERSNHILKNQIYGIALSQVSLERTTKKLLGEDRNIRVIPNYISKLKSISANNKPNDNHQDIGDILNKEFGQNMKFDVVISNPPYQESTGDSSRALAIYQKFIQNSFDIANTVCMITPARWFSAPDTCSEDMRKNVLCHNTSNISYYEKSESLFMGTNINGGVAYFCSSKNIDTPTKIHINGKCEASEYIDDNSIFIPEIYYRNIIKKVTQTKKYLEHNIFARNMFGLETNYCGVCGSIRVKTNTGISDFIDEYDLPKGKEYVNMYKIAVGAMRSSTVIGKPDILLPNMICTGTYTIIGAFSDSNVAQNVNKYFHTKFTRALIDATLNNQRVSGDNYRFVPLQDFTSQSDIDWSQSVEDIDQQLYKKYNLSQDEIDYIEKTIKPMA